MKEILKRTLLKPPYVQWCSQTIYQALLGCIKIYETTKEEIWKDRAKGLLDILFAIQQKDGGFDIGYDFNFGMLHKKGESTSPEMVGLLAMLEYGRVFGFSDELNKRCERAVHWIISNTVQTGEGSFYSPYAPYSTKDVMVYNGTSFVCGALGYYIGLTADKDSTLVTIYEGMVRYLNSILTYSDDLRGDFWYYYDQERTELHPPQKFKIDNYHQMQQVEMHSYAQSVSPVSMQLDMIKSTVQYILNVFYTQSTVPYTNNPKDFGGGIHLWGFSSVISGLIMAKRIGAVVERDKMDQLVLFVEDFILNKAWNGEFFYPIMSKAGNPILRDYMVRSDAWVFNSLASLLSEDIGLKKRAIMLDILSVCYDKMKQANFSGKETHASTARTRFISAVFSKFK